MWWSVSPFCGRRSTVTSVFHQPIKYDSIYPQWFQLSTYSITAYTLTRPTFASRCAEMQSAVAFHLVTWRWITQQRHLAPLPQSPLKFSIDSCSIYCIGFHAGHNPMDRIPPEVRRIVQLKKKGRVSVWSSSNIHCAINRLAELTNMLYAVDWIARSSACIERRRKSECSFFNINVHYLQ